MVNPCTANTFGAGRYFTQWDLPNGPETYDFTRCFVIYAQTGDTGYLNDLSVGILPVLEQNDLGTPSTTPWRTKLLELLNFPSFSAQFAPPTPTPLDFSIRRRSCVLIRLLGDFWRFPMGNPVVTAAPITTKEDFEGHYHQVGRHLLRNGAAADAQATDTYRCISFFTNSPCELTPPVKHPVSLNVELVVGQTILPITIDPDIENKGGNN